MLDVLRIPEKQCNLLESINFRGDTRQAARSETFLRYRQGNVEGQLRR